MDLKKRLPILIGIFAVLIVALPIYVYMFMGKHRVDGAQLVAVNPVLIDRVTWGSADGQYSLLRAEAGNWYIEGTVADSAVANAYIQTLVTARCSEVSEKSVENRKPFADITISTGRGNHKVKVYTSTNGDILLTSSDCDGTVFRTDTAGVFGQLFRTEGYFVSASK